MAKLTYFKLMREDFEVLNEMYSSAQIGELIVATMQYSVVSKLGAKVQTFLDGDYTLPDVPERINAADSEQLAAALAKQYTA